ncbi:aminopeptidase O isoform X2 [Pungitius pungitius]|uniref:aminopeptidase O isoform X2 n=1 Tax=Pungitius pungitius TaxID=134920 RepID=UPI002E13EC11
MEPGADDLPLRANTNHVLVRHYVLDLTVHFDRKVIGGSVVLFLEPCSALGTAAEGHAGAQDYGGSQSRHADEVEDATEGLWETPTRAKERFAAREGDTALPGSGSAHAAAESRSSPSSRSWETNSGGEFTFLLDCCDLDVSKVEEVDVTSVSAAPSLLPRVASEGSAVPSVDPGAAFIQNLVSMPSSQWRLQQRLFSLCGRAPGARDGGSLHFHRDRWSLQVRKKGVVSPQDFPRVLRICYETRPAGASVRWTQDQDNRVCVYTAGSPINNRALFPCQEPPVAMSTWQAAVRAPRECVVLMSGEETTVPVEDGDTRSLIWHYYVTMPMPASTFTLAVGHWHQVTAENPPTLERGLRDKAGCSDAAKLEAGPGELGEADLTSGLGSSISVVKGSPLETGSGDQTTCSDSAFCYSSLEDEGLALTDYSATVDDGMSCSHGDYPCRFTERSARAQQMAVLDLLPRCLAAAHTVLGVHPFPRLDVLIVPAGFSSLGMASPHMIFLSQSVLCAGTLGPREDALSLCGSRICHEIAHSWFGLVIGARDWTEEWISEGFATYLEDVIWAQAKQLSSQQTADQSDLKALLRWRRLSDELQNSEEQLQILRPNLENTGEVGESGSSTIKHALNPDKIFMQVHYLKGYFLLRFLASQVGDKYFIDFIRVFVEKYHGHLILSQDFLQMLLVTFPNMERKGLTLRAIYADWLDRPGIPKWLYERNAVWSEARLVEEVKAEVGKWILLSQSPQGKGRKRKRTDPKVNYKEMTSEQLVMLLELLLEEEELSGATLEALRRTYDLPNQDAEVKHRWCELVVKHAYARAYADVEHFMVHNQAMGVYLYGELMVHEDPEQQALARRCLSLVQEEMDQSARSVVEEMIL